MSRPPGTPGQAYDACEAMFKAAAVADPGAIVRAMDVVHALNGELSRLHREHGIPRQAVADFVQKWETSMDADDEQTRAVRS